MSHSNKPQQVHPIVQQLANENHTVKMKYNDLLLEYNNMKKKMEDDQKKEEEKEKEDKQDYSHHQKIIEILQQKNAELNRAIINKKTPMQPIKPPPIQNQSTPGPPEESKQGDSKDLFGHYDHYDHYGHYGPYRPYGPYGYYGAYNPYLYGLNSYLYD